jgi:Fe-S-cluster containining protein
VTPGSLLPDEKRFACLPGCGLCCSYTVVVGEADQRRLRPAAAFDAASIPWQAAFDGGRALRRERGFCLFLDGECRCTVYQQRPDYCRSYPYLWTSYLRPELDVDFSCPGLGRGLPVDQAQRFHPPDGEAQQAQRVAALREVEALLRAQNRYASPEVLQPLGERHIDTLAEVWSAARPAGAATLRGSGEKPGLAGGRPPLAAAKLLKDAAFLDRHFGEPRWNSHLDLTGEGVTLYSLRIAGGTLHVQGRSGSPRITRLDSIGRLGWQQEALDSRRAYLRRWLRRQLLLRLATNLAVAHLWRGGHVTTGYLQFLTEIDWRLAVLAPALALSSGKETIDRDAVLEAIRGSDGLLRAWCQSARLGATAEGQYQPSNLRRTS